MQKKRFQKVHLNNNIIHNTFHVFILRGDDPGLGLGTCGDPLPLLCVAECDAPLVRALGVTYDPFSSVNINLQLRQNILTYHVAGIIDLNIGDDSILRMSPISITRVPVSRGSGVTPSHIWSLVTGHVTSQPVTHTIQEI